jgi:hypothetical protein
VAHPLKVYGWAAVEKGTVGSQNGEEFRIPTLNLSLLLSISEPPFLLQNDIFITTSKVGVKIK